MHPAKDFIVITDIGSTTTKALLIDNRVGLPTLVDIAHSPTTVEAPVNDVRHGIRRSIAQLEKQSGLQLLLPEAGEANLAFGENVSYFSTSSAGGGLQILVIGLTMFDSASSGKRSAYGAGGVILDTFAIDDKRQAMEQMLAMRNLHPDMILLCGGTDGGAVSGVLRMAEIVRIADPAPKFATLARLPAIYAGNQDAAPIIQKLISGSFDLHILPNLRPSLQVENLKPTQDMIQRLFMENVMEQAPGYAGVKPLVAADILPTPAAVQKALDIASGVEKRNIFAFDIGGATTDVFSYLEGHHQRTVSANLGMSYSALNVLRECGLDNLMRWLGKDFEESDVRDYLANKCLYPTANPTNVAQFKIEHALAREALALALDQHRLMHYNGLKIGYLDKLKQGDTDKYEQIFEYQREEDRLRFSQSDIDILIGAGGIFAHAQNPAQSLLVMIDAFRPLGVTEIWIDRHFISPHLGVLSTAEPSTAEKLFARDCVEKLALHIAPTFPANHARPVLRIDVLDTRGNSVIEVMPDQFILLPAGEKTLTCHPQGKAWLEGKKEARTVSTALPVIIDTRGDAANGRVLAEQALRPYPSDGEPRIDPPEALAIPQLNNGNWIRRVELPYSGDVNFSPGDKVQPDDVVAVNRYNPPRLYVVDGFRNFQDLTEELISASLKVKMGDSVDFDQVFAQLPDNFDLPHYQKHARKLVSPVRGKVEYIDTHTGILLLSEIQNYSSKPTRVDYAAALMLPAKRAKRYLKVQRGDFVYERQPLGSRVERTGEGMATAFVKAPVSGTVTEIDEDKGILTIAYLNKPMEFAAHVRGQVTAAEPAKGVEIGYAGARCEGRVAFGRECHGSFRLLSSSDGLTSSGLADAIVCLGFAPGAADLKDLAREKVRGVICYSLRERDLVEFLGFEPGVINTGNESLPFTILVLGGFGSDPLPSALAEAFTRRSFCYLNPHTRVRAGVVRPFACFS